jgi:hypothetical protein
MSRGLTTDNANAAAASRVVAAYFVELDFSSGVVRAWTGIGSITGPEGATFTGVGELGGISVIEEKADIVATGVQLTLDITDTSLLATALTENYQGRAARIWLGLFNTATLALISTPPQIFGGVMDFMEVTDQGQTGRITVNCESWMRVLERANDRRRTDMDQQSRYSGDIGLEYIPAIQDIAINWGQNDGEQTKQSRKNLKKQAKK